MAPITNSLEDQWMPFSSNRAFKAEPRLFTKAEGMFYTSHKGHRILDGASGLFTTAAGHCRPEITDAVARQLGELDYAPLFQTGTNPSFQLASRLAQLMPGDLNKIFFCNSGSEAIDTSLKMVMAYHRVRGEGHRDRWVGRDRAYHGTNIGGTSLQGLVNNRRSFGGVMPGVVHMRHTWLKEQRFTSGQPTHGIELAEDLLRFCQIYGGENIAACYVEPIAGSTGVLIPPVGYLERLRQICDQFGIVLVFDEVICGFGRLGTPFGAHAFGVTPDIITMAKALTNGAIPMGAVAVSENIYATVVNGAPDEAIEFFHGYTYSGHPAACAAGLATLDIYENEKLFVKAATLSPVFLDAVFALRDIGLVTDIRGYGLLAGIDLTPEDGTPGKRGYKALKALYEAGLHLKFTGDTAIIAPPLISQPEHLDTMFRILRSVLKTL